MKKLWLCLLSLGLIIALCACDGKSNLNEKRVSADLSDELTEIFIDDPINGGSYEKFKISSLTIERQQTENGYDILWCAVEMENEYYRATRYPICYYDYFDKEGWKLDTWELCQEDKIEVIKCPFFDKGLISELSDAGFNIEKTYIDDSGNYCLEFSSVRKYTNADLYTKGVCPLKFSGSSWCGEEDMEENVVGCKMKISGTWEEVTDYSDFEFTLTIDHFDEDSMTAEGSFYYHNGTFGKTYRDDLRKVSASLTNSGLLFDFDDYGYEKMPDYVLFGWMDVYTGEWNTLQYHYMQRVE